MGGKYVKMYLREIRWEGVDWIQLAKDNNQFLL
jgi:hypothetical protein